MLSGVARMINPNWQLEYAIIVGTILVVFTTYFFLWGYGYIPIIMRKLRSWKNEV